MFTGAFQTTFIRLITILSRFFQGHKFLLLLCLLLSGYAVQASADPGSGFWNPVKGKLTYDESSKTAKGMLGEKSSESPEEPYGKKEIFFNLKVNGRAFLQGDHISREYNIYRGKANKVFAEGENPFATREALSVQANQEMLEHRSGRSTIPLTTNKGMENRSSLGPKKFKNSSSTTATYLDQDFDKTRRYNRNPIEQYETSYL